MQHLTRIALVLLLGLTCDCLGQSVPGNKQKSSGAIAGRITLNGKGLADVRVSAVLQHERYLDRDIGYKATTNADGQFRDSSLAAGIYRVWPNVPAYVVTDTKGSPPLERSVVVTEGETIEDINFALIRGGVITGKATDADGRPVIGELVRVIPLDQNLSIVVDSLPGFLTDDRGIYRVYGLPPGSYKVAIGSDVYAILDATRGRRVYKQTFYPDATDEAKAKSVEVAQGAEVSNIDLLVGRTIAGFAVSGRIIDAQTSQPLPGTRIRATIYTDGQRRGADEVGASDNNGNFRLENVPVGTYSISLVPETGTEYVGETNTFEVVDQDVTGLELKAARGATLTGTIALEGTDDKRLFAELSQLHLRIALRPESGFPSFHQLTPNSDGSFRVSGIAAGTARVTFYPRTSDEARFSFLRIERDGIDQSPGLKVKSGEQITELRIVIGYGTGSVRGTVKVENGPLPSNMQIYVLLQRQSVSGPVTLKSSMVDPQGRFLIEWLPAGNYEVAVRVYDAATNQMTSNARQPIVISDGVVSEISIPINLKPNSTPVP